MLSSDLSKIFLQCSIPVLRSLGSCVSLRPLSAPKFPFQEPFPISDYHIPACLLSWGGDPPLWHLGIGVGGSHVTWIYSTPNSLHGSGFTFASSLGILLKNNSLILMDVLSPHRWVLTMAHRWEASSWSRSLDHIWICPGHKAIHACTPPPCKKTATTTYFLQLSTLLWHCFNNVQKVIASLKKKKVCHRCI